MLQSIDNIYFKFNCDQNRVHCIHTVVLANNDTMPHDYSSL